MAMPMLKALPIPSASLPGALAACLWRGVRLASMALCLAWTALPGAPPTAPRALVVGIDRDDRPYEFLDDQGQPAGYDVDLVKALAQVEGLEVTFRADTWENIRARFASGEVDLLPGMLRSKEREAEVAFTAPHLVVNYAIFVRNGDTTIQGLDDLTGRRILVQQRSQMQEFLTARGLGPWLQPVVSEPEALDKLAAGMGEAAVVTKLQGMVIAKQRDLPLSPVAGTTITRQLCLAVHKEDQDLVARLDTALAILNQTGRYAEIYRRWFGHLDEGNATARRVTRLTLLALVLGLAALGTILIWNRSLRRRVDRATAQLRQANQDIREREVFLNTIIENLPVAIFGKDPRRDWTFSLWNHRSEEIFGLSKDQVLGKSDYDFFPVEQSDGFRQKDLEVVRMGKATDIPLEEVTSKSLGKIVLFTRKVPLFDEEGKPMLLLGISENRTEQVAMEEALRQAQKLESLGVLAGGIAHDFNNLLTAILGYLSLARIQAESGEPIGPYLENIERTALRASELTRQMLAYSGRGVFLKAPLALDEAVLELTNLLKVSISKKVQLSFHIDEHLPAIEGDTAQIQQVIMNLVTNASEAIGDAEGEVRISLGTQVVDEGAAASIHPATPVAPGDYVVLKVVDTGIGMSPETLSRIFDPFFTTKFSGRGLGMSAMLGILKAHQAGIRIRSVVGRGTSIEVFLPACEALARTDEPAASNPHLLRSGVTLLVVDDEPDILEATTLVLQQMGFEVLKATDGVEAVAVHARQGAHIHAILMDLTMPRMDGLEAATAILQAEPSARVILTSGFSASKQVDLKGLGISGFLQKPFGRAQLVEALRPVLEPRDRHLGEA